MKILYYNLHLGGFDGSNSHATGILDALVEVYGEKNVLISQEIKSREYNHKISKYKNKYSKYVWFLRVIRRMILSRIQLYKIIKKVKKNEFSPNLIYARSVLYDKTPVYLSKKLKCKLIIEHNTPFYYESCIIKNNDSIRRVERFEKYILDKSDKIFFVSEKLRQMIIKNYHYNDINKFKVIPNGFMKKLYNLSSYEIKKIRHEYREKNYSKDKFVVTFIGSLQIWHGIDLLLNIASQLKKNQDIEFWIIGDGQEREDIEKYIKQNNNVKWFGRLPIKEMRNILYASDMGIMPYKKIENFYFSPLKMFDMIGAKLPFIGLKIGQIDEFCTSNLSDDFLFEEPKSSIIISKILSIKNETKLYKKMKDKIDYIWDSQTWNDRVNKIISWSE